MNPIKSIYCRTFQIGFRIALPILPYRNPKKLHGVEAIYQVLNKHRIKKVLLVVDGGVYNLGLTKGLEDTLTEHNISYKIYKQETPNPTIDDVEAARKLFMKSRAKAIVAVGGGSAMDCAKACGARVARPRLPVRKMRGILKVMRKTPLFIAIPTTAGTGSEATLAAVITDSKTHHKYPINDFFLIPDYALLDSKLTKDLPPFITATTGLDALTHAVEAYIGRSTNKMTRKMSETAVALIYRNLQEAYHNGHNLKARRKMLIAAYFAGASFTRSYVGYVHAIAHSLGGQYGIAHGLANAVILPQFLEIYGEKAEKKLARLAKNTGVAPKYMSDKKAAKHFIKWIYSLNEEFDLPKGFSEIQIQDIPQMSKNADKEANPLYPVPMLMDAKELSSVYYMLKKKGGKK